MIGVWRAGGRRAVVAGGVEEKTGRNVGLKRGKERKFKEIRDFENFVCFYFKTYRTKVAPTYHHQHLSRLPMQS